MSALTPFTFPETGEPVRAVVIDDEFWFVAADVCAILGHTNPTVAIGSLDDDERQLLRRSEALTSPYPFDDLRVQAVSLVSESGLYSLIVRSNLLAARPFKRWVTHEVLPSIRKTGTYGVPVAPRELSRLELIDLAREAEVGRLAAERRVAELAPAAESWETLAAANGDYSVADAAKILSRDPDIQIGRDRLFTVMHKLGWTYRAGDNRWRIKQTAVETGRLSELPSSHYHPRTGELVLDPPQVRVTVKGVHDLRSALGATALERAA